MSVAERVKAAQISTSMARQKLSIIDDMIQDALGSLPPRILSVYKEAIVEIENATSALSGEDYDPRK